MRKAAGLNKRGSRKKHGPLEPKDDRSSQSNSNSNVNVITTPHFAPPIPQPPPTRKPSAEEAALTAKNYRLAKELSELRVRHREECKSVTRLTMENMNLASRCREAISHVAMLKKELAMHQKRAAEALAFQRQQTKRMASDLSSEVIKLSRSLSDDDDNIQMRNEVQRMDSVLAKISPPPSQPTTPQHSHTSEASLDPQQSQENRSKSPSTPVTHSSPPRLPPEHQGSSPVKKNAQSPNQCHEIVTVESTKTPDSVYSTRKDESPARLSTDSENTKTDKSQPEAQPAPEENESLFDDSIDPKSLTLFPFSASPKAKSRDNYDEGYPSDVIETPDRTHQSPSFGRQLSSTGIVEMDEETSITSSSLVSANDQIPGGLPSESPNGTLPSHATLCAVQKRGPISLNSIDAFEASFDTTFPDTFSPRDDSHKNITRSGEKVYDPFFPSPTKSINRGNSEPSNENLRRAKGRESPMMRRSPLVDSSSFSDSPHSQSPNNRMGKFNEIDSPVRTHRETDVPRTPDESPTNRVMHDPDNFSTPPSSHATDQPKRPEKTMSAAARARYEKALQPRNQSTGQSGYRSNHEEPRAKSPAIDMNVNTTSPESNQGRSPSSLLKRIQQRRMRQRMERQNALQDPALQKLVSETGQTDSPQPAEMWKTRSHFNEQPFDEIDDEKKADHSPGDDYLTTTPGRGFSATSMSQYEMDAQFRVLDAMASVAETQTPMKEQDSRPQRANPIRHRRNVKQPVSYAEPALNTKLRSGDSFFPKNENFAPTVVSPEPISRADLVIG